MDTPNVSALSRRVRSLWFKLVYEALVVGMVVLYIVGPTVAWQGLGVVVVILGLSQCYVLIRAAKQERSH